MHYRSTHSAFLSHRRTHTHIYVYTHSSFSSFHWISTHAHMLHHKWWDLNINSMKYSCVSASRSSRTNTKGDLPSDLRIPLHSSLSLSFPNSLSLSLSPVVLQHSEPLSRCCVPVCSWALFYFSVITPFCSQVFFVCLWLGGGQRMTRPQPFLIFLFLAQNVGKVGEMDWLEIRTWGDDSEFERC